MPRTSQWPSPVIEDGLGGGEVFLLLLLNVLCGKYNSSLGDDEVILFYLILFSAVMLKTPVRHSSGHK